MSREGSVKRDESGRWFFVVDLTPPGATKRRQIRRRGFATKSAALAALDEAKGKVRGHEWVDASKVTVGRYLTEWLEGRVATGLRPSTIDSYGRALHANLLGCDLASIPLQALTGSDLDRHYGALLTRGGRAGQGLSARTVRYLHTIVRKALADAVRKRLVARNVADDADPPRASATRAPRPTVWSPSELASFLDAHATHHHGALFRLAAMTGMRRAELCGLRWANVDLDACTVTVVETLTTAGHQATAGQPKTASGVRVIDIDERTVSILRAHRKQQLEQRVLVGRGWRDNGLVFTMPDGSPWHPDVITRAFDRRVRATTLPRIRLHDLRHTHASHLLAAGVNVKVVSERLGHASVSFTLDTYAHVMPGQQAGAAAAAAALVDSL